MKKVPHWIMKVIAFSQWIPEGDMRNDVVDRFITGEFDYESFDKNLRTYHVIYERQQDYDNCAPAIGVFYNQFEAIEAAGKCGIIESCQGYLKRKFFKHQNIAI